MHAKAADQTETKKVFTHHLSLLVDCSVRPTNRSTSPKYLVRIIRETLSAALGSTVRWCALFLACHRAVSLSIDDRWRVAILMALRMKRRAKNGTRCLGHDRWPETAKMPIRHVVLFGPLRPKPSAICAAWPGIDGVPELRIDNVISNCIQDQFCDRIGFQFAHQARSVRLNGRHAQV